VGGGQVRIGSHFYNNIQLPDFIRELTLAVQPRNYLTSHPASGYQPRKVFAAAPDCTLTAVRLYDCVDYFLDDHMILLSEPGDAFCASPEFHIEEAENFIVQAYYCSIGFCTPAALGVFKARPHHRPVILSGDGAFQMTAQEVSTLIRQKCPAIIIIVNNDGYLIERKLHEDGLYNDIQMWKYAELPGAFGGEGYGTGIRVTTEEELEQAMRTAVAGKDQLYLIEAWIPGRDCSAGLERLGNTFRQAQAKKG
jgi:TPP-dependent 2-oxoacid decarboxylase